MAQLYEKVMIGKRTTYREYTPPRQSISSELEPEQVVTMVATMGICLIESIERLLPNKSKLSREVQKAEQAILGLFRNTGKPLDADTVEYCVDAWNETMARISRGANA